MDNKYDVALGNKLKKKRIEKNLSQEDVADRIGITRQAISLYENGSRSLNVKQLKEYCAALEINYIKLLNELDNEV